MRRTIPLLALLLGPWSITPAVHAQQDPLYSQYMFNTLAFNPGYAGSADVFTVMALSRHQWVGFDGAPATQTFLAHTPLRNESIALGLSAINDRIGPARQTSAYADFAYRIRTGVDTRLAFGLKGGINMYQADLASLTRVVENDPVNVNIQSRMLPNFGFGLFWHAPRSYVGISAPKLLENDLSDVNGGVVAPAKEARHYFLMAGYVMDLTKEIKFKPSILFRTVAGAPFSLDMNANFLLRERIWFGAMYRLGNSFGVMGQYRINDQLSAGYAFDLTTTAIGAYNAGTHEVMLSYDFRFLRGRTISPRYF